MGHERDSSDHSSFQRPDQAVERAIFHHKKKQASEVDSNLFGQQFVHKVSHLLDLTALYSSRNTPPPSSKLLAPLVYVPFLSTKEQHHERQETTINGHGL